MDPITLEDALEKKCKDIRWLAWMFLLTTTPTIFNAAHLTSFAFLGGNPSFWCNVPELTEKNWTKEQIKEISDPGSGKQSCVHYAWNYTLIKEIGYDGAVNYANIIPKPNVVKCNSYLYDEVEDDQTVVSQWDLVCDDYYLRSTARDCVVFGKCIGALLFGLSSDKFGRKKIFIFSAILVMLAGPLTALVTNFVMFIVFRILTGVANAGLFESTYTILLEHMVKNYKIYFGNCYHLMYSLGLIYLPVAAYLTNNWRQLQLAISVPMLLLFIHCWFLPESPRWLITKGKLKKASNIIRNVGDLYSNEPQEPSRSDVKEDSCSCCTRFLVILKNILNIYSASELAKRTLICSYLWFFGYLYFFVVAFNGPNFNVDQRLNIGLIGIADIPGILLPVLILMYFGRRNSAAALYGISGTLMIVLTFLPQGWPVMCMALAGRVLATAALRVVNFYTIELFPTENRNTALGSCLAVSQIGIWLAPHIAEILGKQFWWSPTVLCGSLALFGAFLIMFLPETRNTPMLDTIKEMKKYEKEALNDHCES